MRFVATGSPLYAFYASQPLLGLTSISKITWSHLHFPLTASLGFASAALPGLISSYHANFVSIVTLSSLPTKLTLNASELALLLGADWAPPWRRSACSGAYIKVLIPQDQE